MATTTQHSSATYLPLAATYATAGDGLGHGHGEDNSFHASLPSSAFDTKASPTNCDIRNHPSHWKFHRKPMEEDPRATSQAAVTYTAVDNCLSHGWIITKRETKKYFT